MNRLSHQMVFVGEDDRLYDGLFDQHQATLLDGELQFQFDGVDGVFGHDVQRVGFGFATGGDSGDVQCISVLGNRHRYDGHAHIARAGTRVSEISIVGRNTQGVILIRTAEDENVVGLQRVAEPVDDEELDAIDGSAAEGDDDIAPEADTDDDIAEDEE